MIKSERNIVLSATTTTENGERLAEGDFSLKKTDDVLTFTNFGSSGTGRTDPSPRYMLLYYIGHHASDLFRFSLDVGDTWIQEGSSHAWHAQMKTSLEGYEQVEVSAGVFSDCLKHKTVFTGAKAGSTLRSALVNGTRYLWFAKGIGVVKMRYEHANDVVTEAELLEYEAPTEAQDYFPLQVGNMWLSLIHI